MMSKRQLKILIICALLLAYHHQVWNQNASINRLASVPSKVDDVGRTFWRDRCSTREWIEFLKNLMDVIVMMMFLNRVWWPGYFGCSINWAWRWNSLVYGIREVHCLYS